MDAGPDFVRRLEIMERSIFGNGRPGLIDDFHGFVARFETYCAAQEAREGERRAIQRHQASRLNIIVTIIGLIVVPLLVAILVRH